MKNLLLILLLFLAGCSVEKEACKKETKKCCVKYL
jgi:PBP1b-binding outer membrane lipoprotein LpoB